MLGPKESYIEIINLETEKSLAESSKEKYYPLRPSSAGKCTRALAHELAEYYGIAEYEKEAKTADTHRLLSLGHSIEWNLLKSVEDHVTAFKLRYKQQVLGMFDITAKNHPEWSRYIEGSLDAVFWSDDHKAVIDVKSKGNKFHSHYKDGWAAIDEKLCRLQTTEEISESAYWVEDLPAFLLELNEPFFASNFVQLNLYANSDFLIKRGINHASIIQYEKGTSRLREVRFKPSVELFQQVHQKFQNALDAVDGGDPGTAPKDFVLGSISCAYCPFAAECWPSDTKKAFYAGFPKKEWPVDSHKLPQGAQGLLVKWQEAQDAEKAGVAPAEQLIKLLVDSNIRKFKAPDGRIYEIKLLKSPREHFELRQTKL